MNAHDIGVINSFLTCLTDGTLFDARDQIKRLQTYAPYLQAELQAYLDIIDHVFVAREIAEGDNLRQLAEKHIDDKLDDAGLPRSGLTE